MISKFEPLIIIVYLPVWNRLVAHKCVCNKLFPHFQVYDWLYPDQLY